MVKVWEVRVEVGMFLSYIERQSKTVGDLAIDFPTKFEKE